MTYLKQHHHSYPLMLIWVSFLSHPWDNFISVTVTLFRLFANFVLVHLATFPPPWRRVMSHDHHGCVQQPHVTNHRASRADAEWVQEFKGRELARLDNVLKNL